MTVLSPLLSPNLKQTIHLTEAVVPGPFIMIQVSLHKNKDAQ